MRKKRADGVAAADVPPYRRVMPYLMRGRNEAVVYFETPVDLTETIPFIEALNSTRADAKITLFHVVTWAAVQTLARYPHLNRFVAGGRVYDRDGIWISYSAKKELAQGSPIVVLKRRFDPSESFPEMVSAMLDELRGTRNSEETYTDRELDLVLKAQGLPLRGLMALQRAADAFGLLPASFIRNDPLYASLFIANLGSLKMSAPFHHLYEYGTISIFCVIGRVERRGDRPLATLRFSYDERIEDGLYANEALEHLRALVEHPPI